MYQEYRLAEMQREFFLLIRFSGRAFFGKNHLGHAQKIPHISIMQLGQRTSRCNERLLIRLQASILLLLIHLRSIVVNLRMPLVCGHASHCRASPKQTCLLSSVFALPMFSARLLSYKETRVDHFQSLISGKFVEEDPSKREVPSRPHTFTS